MEDQLVNTIKEWIKMDNEIAQLKAEIKTKTTRKKALTTNLVNVMKTNKIDGFDINDGRLVYKKNTTKKAITGKTLLGCLQNYYKHDTSVAEEVAKYIMDNREKQQTETIKLKKG